MINTDRVDHLYQDPHQRGRKFILHLKDLTDPTSLIRIIQKVKPDGVKAKLLDSKRIRDLGWKSKISLDQGLMFAYEDFFKEFKLNKWVF